MMCDVEWLLHYKWLKYSASKFWNFLSGVHSLKKFYPDIDICILGLVLVNITELIYMTKINNMTDVIYVFIAR